MKLDQDFKEFIQYCLANSVRFLVVGGYAVAAHGYPRYTKNLDVWVMTDDENADRIRFVLDQFGFGSLGLEAQDFLEPDQVIQLGYPPHRIDILTSVSGISFKDAWNKRITIPIEELEVPFIGLEDLLINKKASGRLQDLADIENLRDQ